MKPRLSTPVAVLGAAALLVVGTDAVTYATTGQSMILGRINSADRVTP